MISVLTLTYKRPHILEEAIESFVRQQPALYASEMIVINDNPEVEYEFDHPLVTIINCKERFKSISAKIEWGYKQCKYNYIYRLDDDDLLAAGAISKVGEMIIAFPGHELYRSEEHYFFNNNRYEGLSGSVNNGNVYSREYLDRIQFPDKSGDEDSDITFAFNAKTHTFKQPTMIYRWGMGTMHISGLGIQSNETVLKATDNTLKEDPGKRILNPHFKEDYWGMI